MGAVPPHVIGELKLVHTDDNQQVSCGVCCSVCPVVYIASHEICAHDNCITVSDCLVMAM